MRAMTLILVCALLAGCKTVPEKMPAVITQPVEYKSVQYVKVDDKLTEKGPIYHRTDESFGEYWQEARTNTPQLEICYGKLDAISTIEGTENK